MPGYVGIVGIGGVCVENVDFAVVLPPSGMLMKSADISILDTLLL